MRYFTSVRNTILALLLSGLIVSPSPAQNRNAEKKFFHGGDGHIRLTSKKNGKTFSGRYRRDDGHPGNDAYNKICEVFGVQIPTRRRIVSLRLIEFLDFLEDRLGKGAMITITSGYRAPEYNTNLRKKGALAAKASLHQYGMAADFIIEGVPSKSVWEYVQSLGFGGTGYYHGKTVHVDVGPARFWDEKSSGVGTGLSNDNKLIGMVTDFDIYGPGESVVLTFIRMTAFPIKVHTQLKLFAIENPDDSSSMVMFTPRGMGGADGECVEFSDISQMASLRWSFPPTIAPGRYKIAAVFCESVWDQMPKTIATPVFEIRLP